MINRFTKLIENKINIKKASKFAFIIGEKPSSGARSPVLWNKAYRFLNKDKYFGPTGYTNDKLINSLKIYKNLTL